MERDGSKYFAQQKGKAFVNRLLLLIYKPDAEIMVLKR